MNRICKLMTVKYYFVIFNAFFILLLNGSVVAQGELIGEVRTNSEDECFNMCRNGFGDWCNFAYYSPETHICRTSQEMQPRDYKDLGGFDVYSYKLDKKVLKHDMKRYWPSFFSSGHVQPPPRPPIRTTSARLDTRDKSSWAHQGKGCHRRYMRHIGPEGPYFELARKNRINNNQPPETNGKDSKVFLMAYSPKFKKYYCFGDYQHEYKSKHISNSLAKCRKDYIDCKVLDAHAWN